MGMIRLLLSISVIFGHIYISNKLLLGGPIALEAFFIISGFSIAYIYQKKYIDKPYFTFIFSRLLKLLPLYYFILIITLVIGILSILYKFKIETALDAFLSVYKSKYFLIYFFGIFTNLSIVGQDILLLISREPNISHFINTPPLHLLLFVPQSWALALEIYFYLIAPLILKINKINLLIIFIFSLILRYLILNIGLKYDPWIYRFFPADLPMFILGVYSYQIFQFQMRYGRQKVYFLIFIIILFFILFYRILPVVTLFHIDIYKWVFLLSFTLSMPSIFIFFSKYKWDRFCGNLSYHIYLWHILIIQLVYLIKLPARIDGILVIIISIFLSCVTVQIFKPLELFRQNRINLLDVK
jgi:peptidoglycan/LPS O-acetylase OafA/YrhL